MNLVHIDHLSDERLTPYANMRDAELAQRADPLDAAAHAGLFIAEGELVLRRLIAGRFGVHSILTTPTHVESMRDALERLPAHVPIFVADPRVLSDIVGFNMHRGVLGIGLRGAALSVTDLLDRPGPLIVLENLVNHDNIGGIFRNAAALGGRGVGVLLSPRCADPLYRKSLRVSMGTILSVPFARASSWPGALHDVARAGYQVWGLTPGDSAAPLWQACRDLDRGQSTNAARVALVLGSEGPGLTDEAMASCQTLVQIPMNKVDPAVDSLNVSMASGIVLHCLGDILLTKHE